MILPLRQLHRRVFFALGILLPVTFAAGIFARKPVPVVGELPAALAAAPQTFASVEWERADLFTKTPMQVRLWREQKISGRFGIEFAAANTFVKPDLLVYWVTGDSSHSDALPDNAVLLGAFGATTLPLPDEIVKASGAFIIYSVADGEIVDISKPISPQPANASTP